MFVVPAAGCKGRDPVSGPAVEYSCVAGRVAVVGHVGVEETLRIAEFADGLFQWNRRVTEDLEIGRMVVGSNSSRSVAITRARSSRHSARFL